MSLHGTSYLLSQRSQLLLEFCSMCCYTFTEWCWTININSAVLYAQSSPAATGRKGQLLSKRYWKRCCRDLCNLERINFTSSRHLFGLVDTIVLVIRETWPFNVAEHEKRRTDWNSAAGWANAAAPTTLIDSPPIVTTTPLDIKVPTGSMMIAEAKNLNMHSILERVVQIQQYMLLHHTIQFIFE